jgi:hypothetical protein
MTQARPSKAWREEIFSSSPRIDVDKRGTQTTRHPVFMERTNRMIYAWGGYERIALHLLEHLWREKLVRRWKSQPFNFAELGGFDAVPDILVELFNGDLHVIEVRAWRFLTDDMKAKYGRGRDFLQPLGFKHHVWTNHDVLSSKTSHTVAELDRGRMFPAPAETIEAIREAAKAATRLAELDEQFGWDDTLSAAAQLAFHFDITEPLYENTQILRNHSPERYLHLFAARNAAEEWWQALDTPLV